MRFVKDVICLRIISLQVKSAECNESASLGHTKFRLFLFYIKVPITFSEVAEILEFSNWTILRIVEVAVESSGQRHIGANTAFGFGILVPKQKKLKF